MPRITINGLGIQYDLIGDAGAPAIALTPGGRYSMEVPGLRELAGSLARGGRRILLWDRPNCGLSDLVFDGDSEAAIHGRTLAGLVGELDLGPTALAGGSAGARVSMIAALTAPSRVSHLVLWWISGGVLGQMALATYYYAQSAFDALLGGMEAVAASPMWSEQTEFNPEARVMMLAQDKDRFVATMRQWAEGFIPHPSSPLPGMAKADFARLTMPALILRNGVRDAHHPHATTEQVHRLMSGSTLIDPPWSEDEWNERRRDFTEGKATSYFVGWPKLAPTILEFVRS